jgi:hypothetical protein
MFISVHKQTFPHVRVDRVRLIEMVFQGAELTLEGNSDNLRNNFTTFRQNVILHIILKLTFHRKS